MVYTEAQKKAYTKYCSRPEIKEHYRAYRREYYRLNREAEKEKNLLRYYKNKQASSNQ